MKQLSLTAALAHCQAGRTRQDRKQAGLRELLGEEKKIVYQVEFTGSITYQGPTLRLYTATGSRRKIETEKMRETEKGTQAKRLTDRQRDNKKW